MTQNKGKPRDPERVQHMLAAVKAVRRYTAGRTIADFLADDLLQSAVERQFEILGKQPRMYLQQRKPRGQVSTGGKLNFFVTSLPTNIFELIMPLSGMCRSRCFHICNRN